MHGLPKENRLCSLKDIGTLFSTGKSIYSSFITLRHCTSATEVGQVMVMFSVSKRSFKKAVHRNQIKRWMREAYRKNQDIAKHASIAISAGLNLAFVFRGNKFPDYSSCEDKIILTLQRLSEYYANPTQENTYRAD